MAVTARATLKNWFKAGLKPTEAQFANWIDSFFHKSEDEIPLTVDYQNLDTTGTPINVDCANKAKLSFRGTNSIGGVRTWNFQNAANLREMRIRFTLSAVVVQTFNGVKCNDGGWDNSSHQWTPYAAGDYEMVITSDGTDIYLTIFGGFN
jgi:hypothetical protein